MLVFKILFSRDSFLDDKCYSSYQATYSNLIDQKFDVKGIFCIVIFLNSRYFFKPKEILSTNWIQIVKYTLKRVFIKSNLDIWS